MVLYGFIWFLYGLIWFYMVSIWFLYGFIWFYPIIWANHNDPTLLPSCYHGLYTGNHP